MKVYKFRCDTWEFTGHLLVGVSPEDFTNYVRKHVYSELQDHGTFSGICYGDFDDVVIALKSFDRSAASISILSHECLHAACYVLWARDVKLCNKTSEAYTYLQASILKRCLNKLGVK